ncbi:hypothetical protein [Psychrobacter sp. 16-MNA-CIBAN-0192]|uniref:hypothetical protein n=1 Tax=Psychrobacter sp. 16-MNA-CIBAN-0192 TaxID=3140448 RepID=UPI003326CF0E
MLIFSCWYIISALSSFSLKFLIAFQGLLLGVIWAYSFYRKFLTSVYLIDALKLLIYTSFLALVLQFILYNFFNYVDIHSIIFPWSEARYQESEGFIRLGGMYIEPGTLSNWIYALFLLFLLVEDKPDTKLTLATALAMLFSLSAWGVAVSGIVFIFFILQYKFIAYEEGRLVFKRRSFIMLIVGIISILLLLSFFITDSIYSFLESKLLFETGSGEIRIDTYNEFFKTLPDILFFGSGYASDFCINCKSPQDAGLFIIFTVVYGLFFSVLFFLLIVLAFFKKYNFKGIILILPLLTSKIYYWDYIVLLIFFSAFYQIFLFSQCSVETKLAYKNFKKNKNQLL